MKTKIFIAFVFSAAVTMQVYSQQLSNMDKKYSEIANYDQEKVPEYTLPDLLTMVDGTKITNMMDWEKKRRPEIVDILETYMYGKAPEKPEGVRYELVSVNLNALGGKATRKEVKVYFTQNDTLHMNVQIYLPNGSKKPAPLFLGLSFVPNYSVTDDPDVVMPAPASGAPASGFARKGSMASSWQLDMLLENGYGLATVYCADIDPDVNDGFHNGVHGLFRKPGDIHMPDQWGTIAAWAWGLSRAMDYFEQDGDIDHKRVGVVGHSRLGKAAVWAGARDQRFALILSGNSGSCGVAISRRQYGETLEAINVRFPHWFCSNLWQFNSREDKMPFDQHFLVALAAPRPIYIASGETDNWSDQKGEFLGGKYAEPVYELYGLKGTGAADWPKLDVPYATGYIGYHNRTGGHAITAYDWQQFIKFADMHYGK